MQNTLEPNIKLLQKLVGENLPLISVDTESCNGKEIREEIIEIGLCWVFRDNVSFPESFFVKPKQRNPITSHIRRLTGIRWPDLRTARPLEEIIQVIPKEYVFIHWNKEPLFSFLENITTFNVATLYRKIFEKEELVSLEKACNHLEITWVGKPHRAGVDSFMTARVFQQLGRLYAPISTGEE